MFVCSFCLVVFAPLPQSLSPLLLFCCLQSASKLSALEGIQVQCSCSTATWVSSRYREAGRCSGQMVANTHTETHTFWSCGSVRLVTVVLLQKMRYGVADRRWLAPGAGSAHTQPHIQIHTAIIMQQHTL